MPFIYDESACCDFDNPYIHLYLAERGVGAFNRPRTRTFRPLKPLGPKNGNYT